MVAAVKTMTWADRRARCLELALAAHLDYTAREVDLPGRGIEHFVTPSADRRTQHHIWHRLGTDMWRCDCRAAKFGHACGHVGACIHLHEQRERMLAEAGSSLAEWFGQQRATRAWLAAWGP